MGLILAVVVAGARIHDNAIGTRLLDKVAQIGTIQKVWVEQGFKNTVVDHGAELGIDVEVVKRNPDEVSVVQPKRFVVEQTNGALILDRRLVRDYEIDPRSAESHVLWASSANLPRRLTGTTTPTWRGPVPQKTWMPRTTLERIADREQNLTSSADRLREQIAQATARLAEIDAELGELAVARKVVLALPPDEPRPYRLPGLSDNPAYQHILTALTDADRPQRCRDLCLAVDTGI